MQLMPLLRRKKDREGGDQAREQPEASSPAEGQEEAPTFPGVQGPGLEPRLERRWEEAFNRARSR